MTFNTGSPGVLDRSVRVQVCILTFRRPELLCAALASVGSQTILKYPLLTDASGNVVTRVQLQTLVVDNDPSGSAKEIVARAFALTKLSGRYVCEPRRGLSSARNRALVESHDQDYVVFLDDDEAAYPDWLEQLVLCCLKYEADVVTGPVDPVHIRSPRWVIRGGFFTPLLRKTGTPVQWVASNNTLLSKVVFSSFRFDARFDTSGGEDTEFFMRVGQAGHTMIWAENARVSEVVPPERANLRWILKRGWSDANRFTLAMMNMKPGSITVCQRFVIASGGLIKGLSLLLASFFGLHIGARGMQLVARSLGTWSALRGRSGIYYGSDRG